MMHDGSLYVTFDDMLNLREFRMMHCRIYALCLLQMISENARYELDMIGDI
ncbi:hypothetical protein HanPI659440_Chr09g0346821 [Helianthus annuus]|nr:hypothetical protein HanPI659440_Chr09g0346821 [Helianthus annuus]